MTTSVGPGFEPVLEESLRCLKAFGEKLMGTAPAKVALRKPILHDGTDVYVTALYALGFFVLNWGLRLLVVEPLAAMMLGKKSASRAKVQKFAQSSLEMIFYGSFTVFGLLIVPQQPWFWPSENWWIGFKEGATLAIPDDLKAYYLMYAARYMQGVVSVLVEHKRKDFWEMQAHHLVTVGLIALSYAYGWNRVGACVMALLDPADVPLHTAKQFKYIGDARGGAVKPLFQNLADVCFYVFGASFFVMRLVLYPYIVWSAHFEAARYFEYDAGAWACVVLLYILLLLQVYWFALIVKVAIKAAKGGEAQDVRSDDEEEEDDKQKKKKK